MNDDFNDDFVNFNIDSSGKYEMIEPLDFSEIITEETPCIYKSESCNLEDLIYPCDYAALHGDLDALEFAHRNGAKWDTRTCKFAYYNKHYDCVRYMINNGCEVKYIGCVNSCYVYMIFL